MITALGICFDTFLCNNTRTIASEVGCCSTIILGDDGEILAETCAVAGGNRSAQPGVKFVQGLVLRYTAFKPPQEHEKIEFLEQFRDFL